VLQSTLDHSDLGLQVLVADVQWLWGRELIVERLKPVLEEENVMTKCILHGPVWGNGLPLEKDIPALHSSKIYRNSGDPQ
jgi:hypothetical protein